MTDEETPMTTPPNVPVIGPQGDVDRTARGAPLRTYERRPVRQELEEEAGGPRDVQGVTSEDEFVLEEGPASPTEPRPSDPPEGSRPPGSAEESREDHPVLQPVDERNRAALAATRLLQTEERLRFADLQIQFMEREHDLLRPVSRPPDRRCPPDQV